MIKKIHYCWFGGKKLPREVKKCIKTWKKMLPDYEIKEWNENNFDINSNQFVKEAYENKKWAFVSDYVRIYALYQEGGIYLDTDMKILKDVSNIIDKDMFLGYEDSGYIGTAVIGVKEKYNRYIKEILDYYNDIKHFNVDIMYNYANPVIITKILNKYKSSKNKDGINIYDEKIYIYPREYFYPLSYNYLEKVYTSNTCMVHLFNATWTSKGEKRVIGLYRRFGVTVGGILNKIIDKIFDFRNMIICQIGKLYHFARMKYSIYINRGKRVKRIRGKLLEIKDDYLVIYHPENVQVKNILENNFEGNKIELREQYTNKEANLIAKEIINANKNLVIFNELSTGWDKLINYLKDEKEDIKVKLIMYKNYAVLSEADNFEKYNLVLDLYAKGKIDEIEVLNKSMYEFLKEKEYNVKQFINQIEIYNKELYLEKEENEKEKNIRIGLYEAEDRYIKNIYNQLCAISLLNNYELDCSPINYKISMMARKHNINLLGTTEGIPREELYKKMAKNDINLFITFPEFPSIHPIESLELGTICLVGANNNYFKGTSLEKYIVVNNEEDIMEIYNKIKFALENKDKILELYKEWKDEYNKKANDNIAQILKV